MCSPTKKVSLIFVTHYGGPISQNDHDGFKFVCRKKRDFRRREPDISGVVISLQIIVLSAGRHRLDLTGNMAII